MTGLVKVAIAALGALLVAAGIAGAVYWRGLLFARPVASENPATPAYASRTGMPPIDAAAPARTETATFALG